MGLGEFAFLGSLDLPVCLTAPPPSRPWMMKGSPVLCRSLLPVPCPGAGTVQLRLAARHKVGRRHPREGSVLRRQEGLLQPGRALLTLAFPVTVLGAGVQGMEAAPTPREGVGAHGTGPSSVGAHAPCGPGRASPGKSDWPGSFLLPSTEGGQPRLPSGGRGGRLFSQGVLGSAVGFL